MVQYAKITEIVAPVIAGVGSRVDITVRMTNLSSSTVTFLVGGALEYGVPSWPTITFPADRIDVPGGYAAEFNGYFFMPSSSVIIHAYSYFYGLDHSYHFDDQMTKAVGLSGSANLYADYSDGKVYYRASAFQPNAVITFTVAETGGYFTKAADGNGIANGNFSVADPPGVYTLQAVDSYGHGAGCTYTITGGVNPGVVTKVPPVQYNPRGSTNPLKVISGQPIDVTVTWKNTGGSSIQPRFRVDIKGTGTWDSPIEGTFTQSPAGAPGQTVEAIATSKPVPTDWQNGKELYAYVVLEGEGGHWDTSVLLTVVKEDVSFTLSSPTASPRYIEPGGMVEITLPVKSNCSTAQMVTAKVNIYEGSFWGGAGALLATIPVYGFSIAPGETHNIIAVRKTVEGSIDIRDIGLELYIGAQKVADDQWDNIYFVQAGAGDGGVGDEGVNSVLKDIKLRVYTGLADLSGSIKVPPVTGLSTGDEFRINCSVFNESAGSVLYTLDWTITKPSGKTITGTDPGSNVGSGGSLDFIQPSLLSSPYSIDESGDWTLDLLLKADGIEVDTYSGVIIQGAAAGMATSFELIGNLVVMMIVMMMMNMMMSFMESPGKFVQSAVETGEKVMKAAQPIVQIFTGKGKSE